MKIVRRKLIERCKSLEEKIDSERLVYDKLDGNSSRSNLVLRHIKALENAIVQCQTYSHHVESILLDLSEQETMVRVVDALQEGKKATLYLNALLSVEDVKELLEDGSLARQQQQALEDCLSQNMYQDSSVAEYETPAASDIKVLPPQVPNMEVGSSMGRKEGFQREKKRVLAAS